MNAFILPLTDAAVTLANAGGKGANLQRMLIAGFPVPPGYVITTAAYRATVECNQLAGSIAAFSAATQPDAPASYEAASQAIRTLFEQAVMPAEVATAIKQTYATLNASASLVPSPLPPAPRSLLPVAVRSSATAEDLPEASFAGQQETYLNIRGEEALLDAVKRCWSSLWTARAIAYRARQNIAPETVALAVVVQQMAPAQVAGVLFTVNPVTGQHNEMVINATWGLGEALVAGRVNPDTFTIDKATGQIKSQEIGDKLVMTAATQQGTEEVNVTAAQRDQAALTPVQIAELARLGRALESHLAGPQDIEWALAGEQIFLLQTRAVTTLATARTEDSGNAPPGDDQWPPLLAVSAQPFDLWTQSDVGERWPEPVTPLTWSFWQPMINENMNDSMAAANVSYLSQIQWAKRAYGRIYLNEGALLQIFSQEFGFPASMIADGMGSQSTVGDAQKRWQWGKVVRRLPAFLRMGADQNRRIKLFETLFPQIDTWVENFLQRDLTSLSDQALWTEANTLWRPRVMENMAHHGAVTSVSMTNLSMLENMLKRWCGAKELAQPLITGLTGVITAEIVPALRGLADQLNALGLAEVVLANEPKTALQQLRTTPAAAPFLQQLDAFLKRHGHRCATEAELLYPRWWEAPDLVLEAIAGYLRTPDHVTADAEAKQRQQREATTTQINARLDPIRRALFKGMLGRVQHLVRMRDNGQSYLVKLALPMRHCIALISERWAARGWLEQPEDFFFLVISEIEAVLQQGEPAKAQLDLRLIVAERRNAYQHWFTVAAPEVLDKAGQPLASTAPADDHILTGVAASQGKITGTARIVVNPREANRLRPGEILVTRATDPGWTPVFSVISGLVLEVGGSLSHGAIVAREYGLPAVVNVADATRRIQDGQVLTVDGGAGRVYLG
ncbi:MAG: PEP/pyruvate-binding domain-containing protein [Caldilineaceae bacterium]